MSEITLRELYDAFGISRRAVQGYEKAGLVSATSRNKRGYLLYDSGAQERIRKIRLFQEMGFSIREICEIIDAPSPVLKRALEERIERLKEKSAHTEAMIRKAHELIKGL